MACVFDKSALKTKTERLHALYCERYYLVDVAFAIRFVLSYAKGNKRLHGIPDKQTLLFCLGISGLSELDCDVC